MVFVFIFDFPFKKTLDFIELGSIGHYSYDFGRQPDGLGLEEGLFLPCGLALSPLTAHIVRDPYFFIEDT